MKRFLMLVASCLSVVAAPSSSLPLAPPEEHELAPQQAFFRALPNRLPAPDLNAFANHVAENVKVYRAGELVHSNREQWFAFLQSFGPQRPRGPIGITISREEFYATKDGDIVVLEFTWPIAPKGMEDQISYHQNYDLQLVSYRLEDGRLTRLDYGKPMRRYDQWLKDTGARVPRSR